MGVRTVEYLRISKDHAGEGLGVARQGEDCAALIAGRRDWVLVAEPFMENDASANGRTRRPKFEAMLAMIEAGEVDAVVAWAWDRLTRNRRDELRFIEACQQHSVVVALARGSDIDMSTPAGRLTADVLASVARHEIDQKADRQGRANMQQAKAGHPAGPRAFGYEADGITIRESEAQLLREAYAAILAGASASSVAAMLNDTGVTTTRGRPWNHQSVKQVLTNDRNRGKRRHIPATVRVMKVPKGTTRTALRAKHARLYDAMWEPIIHDATFTAAVAVLTDTRRRTNHVGGQRRRLMTGVGLCGVCADGKTTVVGGSKGAGMPLYQCPRSKHLQRALEPVDRYVTEVLLERLSREDATELLVDATAPLLDVLAAERGALVKKQELAATAFVRDAITMDQLTVITEETAARIAEIDEASEHRDRRRVLGDLIDAPDVHAAWKRLPLDRQQAVLATLGTWTIGRGKIGGHPSRPRYVTPADYNIVWEPAPGIAI